MNQEPPSIYLHEKLAVILLIAGMLALTFVVRLKTEPKAEVYGDPVPLVVKEIEVEISGAVEKPGIYRVKKGTLLKEAIEQSQPEEDANLSRFKPESELHRSRKIHIGRKNRREQQKKENNLS